MKQLANLRRTVAFPASRVYRCYNCDHVVQQAPQKGRLSWRPYSSQIRSQILRRETKRRPQPTGGRSWSRFEERTGAGPATFARKLTISLSTTLFRFAHFPDFMQLGQHRKAGTVRPTLPDESD